MNRGAGPTVTAAVQTLWCELAVGSLADAGVRTCVISPGSRSTPLVAALAADDRFDLATVIDERAAAFFALGIARATGEPPAIVCTSGSAAAHYLPAIVEASMAGVPLIVLTADRPPELQHAGASQTIDQIKLYGDFVRASFDLGAPVASVLALRALRHRVVQATALARGPHPGPVHLNVPLRKPLEPTAPADSAERALAAVISELRATRITAAPPRLAGDAETLAALADAISAEPFGVVVAGALPASASAMREAIFELCIRAGYPLIAEASSQLRFGPRPAKLVSIDAFDIVLGAAGLAGAPPPRLIVQLGAEPVAAGWQAAQPLLAGAERWVLAQHTWQDPDSTSRGVVVGDVRDSAVRLVSGIRTRNERSFQSAWLDAGRRAALALARSVEVHPDSEVAAVQTAVAAAPPGAIVQIGNSLPIRVVDHTRPSEVPHPVIAQRGAAGIDGLIASAAGATRPGAPVLLVLGDVSFAHDVGGLLATREARAPLAIVVLDNGGGRIFAGLPIARAGLGDAFERHFVTAPQLDVVAVATAFGVPAIAARSPAQLGDAVATALTTPGVTVVHVICSSSGAHDVRRHALDLAATGGSHA
jgi:2-succinyl-5-enolpyruvyl-6-hydroxy-3-cyclohexene-1-carboxylate synthase